MNQHKPTEPRIRRHFPGWHEPMIRHAVEELAGNWQSGPLDIRSTLVIVPTRHCGRRLREALAEKAAERDSAVLTGPVAPPEFLLRLSPSAEPPIATATETMAAWCRLLLELAPDRFPVLFPELSREPEINHHWALGTAAKLIRLQRELAENGLTLDQAGKILQNSELEPEPERWNELAALEQLYLDELRQLNRQDTNTAKIAAADQVQLPDNITGIKLFAVADPLPLTLKALRRLSRTTTIDIFVHAPPEMAAYFDQWGRPEPDKWQSVNIPIDNPEDCLKVEKNPEKQAERVACMLSGQGTEIDNFAVGIPDEDVLPFLENELRALNLQGFNPAGRPLDQHSLTKLARLLLRFLPAPEFGDFAALLRHPALIDFWQQQKEDLRIAPLLDQVDTLQNQHLPVTFADLEPRLQTKADNRDLEFVYQYFSTHLQAVDEGTSIPRLLSRILEQIHTPCRLTRDRPRDQEFRQAARALTAVLREVEAPTVAGLKFPPLLQLALIEARLQTERFFPERLPSAVDLQGWLELAWEDAPHLIVTGMNEGKVPAAILGDPFLPDRARTVLGLNNNQRRFARDAFLFQSLIEARRSRGSTTFVLGRQSSQGDPLKPSRLLFLCSDQELPGRAGWLFAPCREPINTIPRSASWRLQLPPPGQPAKLSVTQLNDYLACPFRFYLRHVLAMERKDDTKMEMDALDFGTLCHAALQALAAPELQGITDSRTIETRILAALDRHLAARFGQNPPPALYFQLETMRQRLRAAARCQAELQQQGWQVIDAETEGRKSTIITINGMNIHGRLDRIDRHHDGTIRVLDYKTAEKGQHPTALMWSSPRPELTRDYALININGRAKAWTDLQLPLYLLMARQQWGSDRLQAGLFHLPKALAETGVQLWEDINPAILDSARDCVAGIVTDIRAGRFWPPAEKVVYDDFADLFQRPVEENFAGPVTGGSSRND